MRLLLSALLCCLFTSGALAQAVTFDPTRSCVGITFSNGNLTAAEIGSANDLYVSPNANIPAGAKVYFELVQGPGYSDGTGTGMNIGLYNGYFYPQPGLLNNIQGLSTCHDGFLGAGPINSVGGIEQTSIGYFATGTVLIGANAGNGFASVATWLPWKTNGTVISVAVDTVNKKFWTRINGGNWDNSSAENPATNTGGIDISSLANTPLVPAVTFRNQGGGQITGQFAANSWSFTPPSGFSALTPIPAPPPQVATAISGSTTTGLHGTSTLGIQCSGAPCDGSLQFNFLTDAQSGPGSRFPAGVMGPVAAPFCDGVHDDAPALKWLTDSITANFLRTNPFVPITINFPSTGHCMWKSCPAGVSGLGTSPLGGVNLTLNVTGATMTSQGGCSEWGIGGIDFVGSQGVGSSGGQVEQDNFNSSNIGDTCVTMVNPGDEAFYPVGRWVTVAGQGLQIDSFPPNYANWEFAQVASTGAGKVCFTAPLAHAYPTTGVVDSNSLNPPGVTRCSNAYCGGPGRLVRMSASWGGYVHVIGGTWNWDNEINWTAHTVINDNITFTSGNQWCYFPSNVQLVIFNNNTYNSCTQEVDKEIGTMILNNTQIANITVQSQSINSITLNNNSATGFSGTPPILNCNNSHANMFFGAGFGTATSSFFGVNCNITNAPSCCFQNNTFFADNSTQWVYIGSGQFRIANECNNDGACLPPFTTVGGPMVMQGPHGKTAGNQLTIGTSFLESVTRKWIFNTSLSSGASLPPPGAPLGWTTDPLRNFNCSGCTGSPFAREMSMAPAQGQPIFTYINRTYTCTNNVPNVPNSIALENGIGDSPTLEGVWTSFTVNVTTADTNPSDATPELFLALGWLFNQTAGTENFINGGQLFLNLATTGTRTITPTGISPTITGDGYTNIPGASTNWIEGSSTSFGTNVTNGPAAQCPVFNITWQTTR